MDLLIPSMDIYIYITRGSDEVEEVGHLKEESVHHSQQLIWFIKTFASYNPTMSQPTEALGSDFVLACEDVA